MAQLRASGDVVEVCSSARHQLSKERRDSIQIRAGFGVLGDAHTGKKVQHRSRLKVDPEQPNLRQVHLIAVELLEELDRKGFEVDPCELGENITTRGIDLVDLSQDTILRIGDDAVLSVMGLRNPCMQIEKFSSGLLNEMVEKQDGQIKSKAGIMCIALSSGTVEPGDPIHVFNPEGPQIPLERI